MKTIVEKIKNEMKKHFTKDEINQSISIWKSVQSTSNQRNAH